MAEVLEPLVGTWRSDGYGLALAITPDQAQFIEHTAISAVPHETLSGEDLAAKHHVEIDGSGDVLHLRSDGALSPVAFHRVEPAEFDQLCSPAAPLSARGAASKDPRWIFEVMWHSFAEHYAFFERRQIDWEAVRVDTDTRLGPGTGKKKLRSLLVEVLEGFGDGHVDLDADGDEWVSVDTTVDRQLRAERRQHGVGGGQDRFWDREIARFDEVIAADYLGGRVRRALDDELWWGRIGPDTGYLRIDSLSELTGADDESARVDLAALQPALDEVIAQLHAIPTLIIDVRLNGGGHDSLAVAIASRFAKRPLRFGSKWAVERGRRTAAHDLVVEPSTRPRYEGRVALLTSGETASAAEVLTMAMGALAQVTVVGDATEGILSDELWRTLPNGWEVSLSNEVYVGLDGEVVEVTGVRPDIAAPFPSFEHRRQHRDPGIDAALAWLGDPRHRHGTDR